jgi:hypothetical protein
MVRKDEVCGFDLILFYSNADRGLSKRPMQDIEKPNPVLVV